MTRSESISSVVKRVYCLRYDVYWYRQVVISNAAMRDAECIKWRRPHTPWRDCVTSGVEGDVNARSGANGDSNARPGANGNARRFRASMATWLNDPVQIALHYCLSYVVGDAIGSQADLAPRQRNRDLGRFRRRCHSVQSSGRHVFLLMPKPNEAQKASYYRHFMGRRQDRATNATGM